MKKITVLNREIYHLLWNGKYQLVSPDRAKVKEFIINSISNCYCKQEQFSISSNFCPKYEVNKFINS